MKTQQTLAMIKPDAVGKKSIGKILARYEEAGLHIAAMKEVRLSKKEAEAFYEVHKEKPFYGSLTTFMSSGPIVALVLEGEEVISRNRKLMGSTNPKEAALGTLRKDFATDVEKNAVHGSDAPETAQKEIAFFFSQLELIRSSL